MNKLYQCWLTDNLFLIIQIHKRSLVCSLAFLKTGSQINVSYGYIAIIHKSLIPKWLQHRKLCLTHEVRDITRQRTSDVTGCRFYFHTHSSKKTRLYGNTDTSIKASVWNTHSETRSNPHLTKCQAESLVTPVTFFRQSMPTFGEQLHVNFRPWRADGWNVAVSSLSEKEEEKRGKVCIWIEAVLLKFPFPALNNFPLCICVNVWGHWWLCVPFLCSSQLLCPLRFWSWAWISVCACVCACVRTWDPAPHKNLSFVRVSSQSVVRLWMGGLNLPIAAESHISVIRVYDTDGGGGGLQHNREEKQTGLQGDREDFWDWNQCAYYETGKLNRLDDEPRAWWSGVITGKLQTFLSARQHFT